MPYLHELKVDLPFFKPVWFGLKTAELRSYRDRTFHLHDHLLLREWTGREYTGWTIRAEVTHIVWPEDGPWLEPGHCMLSFRVIERKTHD